MNANLIASLVAILDGKSLVYYLTHVYFSRFEIFLIIVNILVCAYLNYYKIVNIRRVLCRNYRKKFLEQLSSRFSNFNNRRVNY